MLNIFPTMWLSLFAYGFLRIVLGSMLLYLGYRHLARDRTSLRAALQKHGRASASFFVWAFGVVEIVSGGMFFVGAYTQIAALIAIILSIKMLVFKRYFTHPSIPQSLFYILVFAVSASLFITGAGAFAFDLPL